MGDSGKFWDRIAERYSRQPVADQTSYQRKLKITQKYLNSDMEVLEIGCGTGTTAIIHSSYVKHIKAIDISAKMIEIAQGKADAQGVANISFEQCTIDELKVDEQTIDVVLALNILHLLDNKEEVIAKVFKILKPGGMFISSTSCLDDNIPWLKLILPVGKLIGLMPSVTFFTKEQLEGCLSDAGFDIEYSWRPGKGKAVFIVAKKP
jgi:ubiquinone/menaquinone biosynthesis C-methylase UbiE